MLDHIVEATKAALESVTNPRFFRTERGYQGRFYCALHHTLEDRGLFDDEGTRILEMEYQKTEPVHGTAQRPDVVFHVPREVSGDTPDRNNYAVWAFKRAARPRQAQADFEKLDWMFRGLDYPMGFFINVDSDEDHLQEYKGPFACRLFGCGVRLVNGRVAAQWRWAKDIAR